MPLWLLVNPCPFRTLCLRGLEVFLEPAPYPDVNGLWYL